LVSHVDKLSRLVGDCERIHQTCVPLNYARHSLRALTLWLLSLPFALVKDLQFLTGPALFLVSWLLFGVYEIGYAIEDPFQGTLRLSIICDTIRRDVLGDEIIRSTAFNLDDGENVSDEDDDDDLERESEDDELEVSISAVNGEEDADGAARAFEWFKLDGLGSSFREPN
jgi:Bestrophin, RFP-TM, chloride channel